MGEFAIGQSVPRFEDPRLVKGGGRYVGDMVLPGMAFGHVLRSPHAHARIRSIDTAKAKASPGVLAVLTGADWQTSGWGDLPVPGGLTRRDGSVFKPPYPALVKDRVRWVGDYVAFVVAEGLHQAMDAAELIAVDYESLPATVSTAAASANGAPKVWDGCADNIGFVQLFGDKAAADAAFAKADHVVKHRFVINRVTAASMEPRGALGDYNAAEDRYTIYTTLQRVHPYRSELSPVLKVPESKIRVVAGDIGGSFGMKSAVYNEVALVLLASKLTGRPVKWMSTRSESFLCDAQARDNVTEAELALDKQGHFLAMRANVVAAIGAYLQTGMQAFTGKGRMQALLEAMPVRVITNDRIALLGAARCALSSSFSAPCCISCTAAFCSALFVTVRPSIRRCNVLGVMYMTERFSRPAGIFTCVTSPVSNLPLTKMKYFSVNSSVNSGAQAKVTSTSSQRSRWSA